MTRQLRPIAPALSRARYIEAARYDRVKVGSGSLPSAETCPSERGDIGHVVEAIVAALRRDELLNALPLVVIRFVTRRAVGILACEPLLLREMCIDLEIDPQCDLCGERLHPDVRALCEGCHHEALADGGAGGP